MNFEDIFQRFEAIVSSVSSAQKSLFIQNYNERKNKPSFKEMNLVLDLLENNPFLKDKQTTLGTLFYLKGIKETLEKHNQARNNSFEIGEALERGDITATQKTLEELEDEADAEEIAEIMRPKTSEERYPGFEIIKGKHQDFIKDHKRNGAIFPIDAGYEDSIITRSEKAAAVEGVKARRKAMRYDRMLAAMTTDERNAFKGAERAKREAAEAKAELQEQSKTVMASFLKEELESMRASNEYEKHKARLALYNSASALHPLKDPLGLGSWMYQKYFATHYMHPLVFQWVKENKMEVEYNSKIDKLAESEKLKSFELVLKSYGKINYEVMATNCKHLFPELWHNFMKTDYNWIKVNQERPL